MKSCRTLLICSRHLPNTVQSNQENSHGRGLYRRCCAHRGRPQARAASPAGHLADLAASVLMRWSSVPAPIPSRSRTSSWAARRRRRAVRRSLPATPSWASKFRKRARHLDHPECGSSQQALHFAQAVMSGTTTVIAAGVESYDAGADGLPRNCRPSYGLYYKSPNIEKRFRNIGSVLMRGRMRKKTASPGTTSTRINYHSHQRAIAATQGGKFKRRDDPAGATTGRGRPDRHPHRRRGHPLRRPAPGHQRRQAVAEAALTARHVEPDLRRRIRRYRRSTKRAEGAWREADGPHPPHDR